MAVRITSNAGEVSSALRELQRELPDQFRRSLITFSMGMKTAAAQAVSTGKSSRIGIDMGFRPKAALTREILRKARAARKQNGAKMQKNMRAKFGGFLGLSVRSYSDKDGAFIGHPDGLAPLTDEFQSEEHRPFTSEQRRRFYQMGIDPKLFGGSSRKKQRLLNEYQRAKESDRISAKRFARAAMKYQKAKSAGTYSRPARDIWTRIARHDGTAAYMLKVVLGRMRSMANQAIARVNKRASK